MQDLNDKITGNSLTAAEWNEVPSEIQNVIEGLGIALSGADLNQLGKAIAGYAANGSFYADSGAVNAYVLSVIGSKQAPTAYTDGMEIAWIADNASTGAFTVNVAGLGVKNGKTLGGNVPAAGDVSAIAVNYARYDAAGGVFILQDSPSSSITQVTITPPTNADVTLTNAQATRDRLVLVDGAWAANHNIIVPNEARLFYIDNSAGTYNATIRTVAGSGVLVLSGDSAVVVCDGVDVVDPISVVSSPAGKVVQSVTTQDGAVATGTTIIPKDDTIPQNTEGDEYLSATITPTSATNILRIEFVLNLASGATTFTGTTAALFQDSTADALAATWAARDSTAADARGVASLRYEMVSGTVSPTTFKVRAGTPGAGTTTVNGEAAGRLYGGVYYSSITITEIVA